jgi:hypothetical protein
MNNKDKINLQNFLRLYEFNCKYSKEVMEKVLSESESAVDVLDDWYFELKCLNDTLYECLSMIEADVDGPDKDTCHRDYERCCI